MKTLSEKIPKWDSLDFGKVVHNIGDEIKVKDVKEAVRRLKAKSDDAGHFNHDTKVIRIQDLIEIFGKGLT